MTQKLVVDRTKEFKEHIEKIEEQTITRTEELRDLFGYNFEDSNFTAERIEKLKKIEKRLQEILKNIERLHNIYGENFQYLHITG